MGRSGGGGGHSSGGHSGGGHHGSSHHSSFSSHSSSSFHSSNRSGGGYHSGPRPGYGGGYHSGPRPGYGGPRHYHGGPGMPPPPPRPYYGPGYRRVSLFSSCLSFIIVALFFLIIGTTAMTSGSALNDNNLAEYAEQQYKAKFNGREDGFLLVIVDTGDDEYDQIKYGTKANPIMDRYQDIFWDNYDRNYNNDLGIQIRGALEDTLKEMTDITPITPDKSFDSHCYEDHLNWVDTKSNLVDGAKEFYEATGIQLYVMLVKSKTVAKATNKSSGVLKILIIAIAAIIIVKILFDWWKKRIAQKNKEQEDLERTLSTPLESFGSTPMDDLTKKYDDIDNKQQ